MDWSEALAHARGSVPWGIVTLLFTTLVAGVSAVWRAVNTGGWVRKEEHERLKDDRDWWRNEAIAQQQTNAQLSQTNAVAVGRITRTRTEQASHEEPSR